jgi:hypothetical protein
VLIANDDLIAGILNRNGLVTGYGNRWTRERVTAHRSHHKIPVFRPAPDGKEPWLNLTNAAAMLGIAPKTLRLAAEAGEIEGVHPLPDGPWIFSRTALAEPKAQLIALRASQNPKHPTGPHPDQQTLFSSMAHTSRFTNARTDPSVRPRWTCVSARLRSLVPRMSASRISRHT